jgi:hypothetical protein
MSANLRATLWPQGPRSDIWAIIDTARDRKAYWTLANSHLNYSCLFAGDLPLALEQAAPYLVQLDYDDAYTDYLAANLGNSLGVFLQCDAAMKTVRHHLRKLLTVRDPRGAKLLFRFYDPRVLRVFLPTCDSSELAQMYGPIKTYWAEDTFPNKIVEFRNSRKGLEVASLSVIASHGGSGGEGVLLPAVLPATDFVLLSQGRSAPPRVPIVLQSIGRGGQLHRTSGLLRLFRTSGIGEPIPFVDNCYNISSSSLDPDLTLYAEASAPGQETLTLQVDRHEETSATLTFAQLTLETGAGSAQHTDGIYVGCPSADGRTNRTRIVVHPPKPATVPHRFSLRSAPGGPALSLFHTATGGVGENLADGVEFDAPKEPRSFWLEAQGPSARRGDGLLQLGLAGVEGTADFCVVTAAAVGVITAATEPGDRDLVLLAGVPGPQQPIALRASVTPGGVPFQWSLRRCDDDDPAVIALSSRSLPTLVPGSQPDEAALFADSIGSFELLAQVAPENLPDGDWGGPQGARSVVIIQAALESNDSAFNGRFCRCAVESDGSRFVLSSIREGGTNSSVQLAATVRLVGGGPDGQRGANAVSGAWVHNVIFDNTGARYKGGVSVERENPALDGLHGTITASVDPAAEGLGLSFPITTGASPAAVFDAYADGRPEKSLEQIWSYFECRSALILWSEAAPEYRGALLEVGWSFTGDYSCSAGRVAEARIPAKLAPTSRVAHASPLPVAQAGITLPSASFRRN